MGNKDTSVINIDDIHFETSLGCKLVLKDVRHVLNLQLNLISTGKLDEEGYNNFGNA